MKIITLRRFFIVMIVAALIFVMAPLWAGDCDGHSCRGDVSVDTSVPVDSNVSVNHTSKSFGFGAGDVDIAQCYRSYSVIVWQDSRINPVCLADSLDAKGLHTVAAMVRCDIRAIRKHFGSDDECIDANTMRPAPVAAMPESKDEDDEDIHEELLAEVKKYEVGYADLKEKVLMLESRKPPQATRQVVQQPALSAEQRAKLREAVK